MQNNTNIPWVEKYRPNNFDKIVLSDMNKKMFQNILRSEYFPNLLFYGPPGTGKTTTIINLITAYNEKYSKNSKGSVIHLNASDERGIDIIRNQILQFVRTNNFFENSIKFVILDEVDYMTKNAQQALKYLLQFSNYNVRYCLICNYISKIDESLKNEFICVRFNQLPKDDIFIFIKSICVSEKLKMSDTEIQELLNLYNSDIRSMINFIQLNQKNKKCIESIITHEVWDNLHELLLTDKTEKEILLFFTQKSIQYNTDKKNLIKKYILYLIQNEKIDITSDFLKICQNITHLQDGNIQTILKYMINQFKKFMIQKIDSSSS
jgi:DNA polymerase III delta prime subunit